MTHQTITKPVAELNPDPKNPRLVERPGDDDRDSLIQRTWSMYHTAEICQSILDGLYIAPEPMLGLLEPDDSITVVDGNRRLTALTVAHDPETWRALSAHQHLETHTGPLDAEATADVVILDSWDEIHRYRVRRHKNTSRSWNAYVAAHDQRRMVRENKPHSEIVNTYDYPTQGAGSRRINTHILALNLTEQLQGMRPNPGGYPRSVRLNVDFNRLHMAIQMPNIAEALGLGDPGRDAPDSRPLTPRYEANGLVLATLLWGDPKGRDQRHPKVATEEDIKTLGDIYSSLEEVQKLLDWPNHSIRSASNRLKDHHEMWDVKRQLAVLHSISLESLKGLKDARPDLVPRPGTIQVGHTTLHRP